MKVSIKTTDKDIFNALYELFYTTMNITQEYTNWLIPNRRYFIQYGIPDGGISKLLPLRNDDHTKYDDYEILDFDRHNQIEGTVAKVTLVERALNRLALLHLYHMGYSSENLLDFELSLVALD